MCIIYIFFIYRYVIQSFSSDAIYIDLSTSYLRSGKEASEDRKQNPRSGDPGPLLRESFSVRVQPGALPLPLCSELKNPSIICK